MWLLVGAAENGRCNEVADRDAEGGVSREIATVRTALEAARMTGGEAVVAAEFGIRQTEALERERDKTKTLIGELDLARTELDMTRLAIMSAWHDTDLKLEAALDQEHRRSESFASEVAWLQAELDKAVASKAGNARTATAEQSPGIEREQGSQATVELARLQVTLDKTRTALADAETTAASRAREREALNAELTRQREIADAASGELTRRAALLDAAEARTSRDEDARRMLQSELASERQRSSAVAQELASARHMIERNTQLPAAPRCEASATSAGETAQPAKTDAGSAPATLPARVSDLELASATPAGEPDTVALSKRAAPVAAGPRALADEARLLARVSTLLRDADIGAARALLQHAVERGSARAAFMLAETYNVQVLQSWRAQGISGDPVKARELYERAQAGGIDDAKEKLRTLQ